MTLLEELKAPGGLNGWKPVVPRNRVQLPRTPPELGRLVLAHKAFVKKIRKQFGSTAPTNVEPTRRKPVKQPLSDDEKEQLKKAAAEFAAKSTSSPSEGEVWKDFCSRRMKELSKDWPDGRRSHMMVFSIEFKRGKWVTRHPRILRADKKPVLLPIKFKRNTWVSIMMLLT